MSSATTALLLGKGPQGVAWLHGNYEHVLPWLARAMIVSVSSAWTNLPAAIPEYWVDYVVANDRLDHRLPAFAGLVQPDVQWGISVQRGFLNGDPAGPKACGRAPVERQHVCHRGVGLREAEERGLWRRTREEWWAANELVQGPVSGVTAMHFLWCLGVAEVLAVGFDGGVDFPAGHEPTPHERQQTEAYAWGLWWMRKLARQLGVRVCWLPDNFAQVAGRLGGGTRQRMEDAGAVAEVSHV